jgi:glycosyltransferase involved in cell wall biosynthesis/SAM-dependent methyltransferase
MTGTDDFGNIDLKTVEGFGEEWAAYDQEALNPAEHRRLFEAYFSPFPFDTLPPDSVGFDLGCGTGRWAALAAERVGHLHCIDPSEKALDVARRRLSGQANVTLHQAGVDAIPLPDSSQDFGYSLGVLHHIPDTAKAMASCVRKLKPGAPFLVYIYYNFDNRPRWFRSLWKITDLARIGISRLPFRLRKAITVVLATLVYFPLSRTALLLERLGLAVDAFPLSAYRNSSFYTMRTDALDRFGTRLEQRFPRSRIRQMMIQSGLGDIVFREAVPYWVACGRKLAEVKAPAAAHQPADESARVRAVPPPATSDAPVARAARPMKLVFLIKSLGVAGGGAERVLADVTSGLAARGHDVTVVSYDRPGTQDFYPIDPAVRRIRLGVGREARPSGLWETLHRMRAVRRLAVAMRPDVLIGFMHSIYIPQGIALLGTGIPVVASEHIVFDHYRTKPMHGALLRLTPHITSAVTAISERVRASFPASIRRRMVVIPNPVSVAPAERADVAGPGRKTLLSVGRLTEQKDQRTLVAAFAELAERFPDWDLRIVGEGELRSDLERQIERLGLGARIALPGTTADIHAEYLNAQLFAMPSAYESFGLATAEALAHGLPAVGFADCPGTNEIIVDGVNGLLVEGGDRVAALAAGLAGLMGSGELRAGMAAAAPASVTAFDPELVVDRWEELAARMAGGDATVPTRLPDSPPAIAGRTKIVHIIPLLTKGGGERVAVDLANQAAEAGSEVTILSAFAGDPGLLPAPLHPDVQLRYVSARARSPMGRYLGVLPWVIRNRRWLAEQDILHCHMSFGAVLASAAQLVAWLTGTGRPAVVETYHAVGEPIPRRHRWLHARLAGWRDGLVLMAEDDYWTSFLARRPRLPSRVIPNGISFGTPAAAKEEGAASYRKEIGLPADCQLVMGTVGRLAPERVPALYIPVFARVARAMGEKVHFIMAGAGPELGRLRSLVRELGLEEQVHFVGMVKNPGLPMSLMDLYITVNVGSVTGIAALEAAYSGLPLVAIQLCKNREARPTDWIWSSGSLDAVADRAIDLMRDPEERAALARRQREHVLHHHTAEIMAESYRTFYAEVLRRKRR